MKKLGSILYGSQNYGLDIETSDFDYFDIFFPTKDDIYKGTIIGTGNKKDVRRFFAGISKSNFNSVELLFSKDAIFYDEDFYNIFKFLKDNINNFFLNNFKNFFLSTQGLIFNCLKKGDLKNLARTQYFLDLLILVSREKNISEDTFIGNHSDKAKLVRLGKQPLSYSNEEIKEKLTILEPLFQNSNSTFDEKSFYKEWFWKKII